MLLLLLILLGVLVAIILIFLKEILFAFNVRLQILRSFLHQNSGVFTLLFIFLFFIEQILLLLFVSTLDVDGRTQLFIGIFALIVLTTATVEKFILEKKNQYLASQVYKLSYDNEQNLKEMKRVYEEGKKLMEHYEKFELLLKKKR